MLPRSFAARMLGGPFLAVLLPALAIAAPGPFESLGEPVRIRSLRLDAISRDQAGHFVAWGGTVQSLLAATTLIGVRTDTGEVLSFDLSQYGEGKIAVAAGADGNVYVYAGCPAHFFRYNVHRGHAAKRRDGGPPSPLEDLGVPLHPSSYFAPGACGRDGRFYVGTYPRAALVCCDTRTGKIENLGRLPDDPRQFYLYPSVAVADDGMVYAPAGLHHMELWAYDSQRRTKKQILPQSLTQLQGSPRVWTGPDGQVYGKAGESKFRCTCDGIELGKTASSARPPLHAEGDTIVGSLNEEGQLELTDATTGKVRWLPTKYQGQRCAIFSVGCQYEGKIYGSCLLPGRSFCYDPHNGRLCDLGVLDSGRCQVYDTIGVPKQGLYLASYCGAYVDFFDPDKPIETGSNPHKLGNAEGQERPIQWCVGPDQMLYTGTEPAKGRLGGTLLRVDPATQLLKVWPSPVASQSIEYLAAVPERDELFCTTSVFGGSSALPTEKEACVFLWNVKSERMVFQTRAVPGTREYGRAVRARNGLIYGIADSQYYAFNPLTRSVLMVRPLPVSNLHFPELNDDPVGPRGLIYGLGDNALFAIDPLSGRADVVARHESIRRAFGFYVTPQGVLYYGSGATLMRCPGL